MVEALMMVSNNHAKYSILHQVFVNLTRDQRERALHDYFVDENNKDTGTHSYLLV